MPSRILARLAAVAMTLGLLTDATMAQDKWPSRPITVIVPFAAGGNTDVMARIFAEQLARRLGQQFIIENKPGGGGVTGLNARRNRRPTANRRGGHLGRHRHQSNPYQGQDPLRRREGFTYLYGMAAQANIWLVNASVPVNKLTELIAWLKANPGTPYATSGPGTTQQCAAKCWPMPRASRWRQSPTARPTSHPGPDRRSILLACDNFAVAIEQVSRQAARDLDHVARALSARQGDHADGHDRAGLRTDAGVRMGRPRQHAGRYREEAD